MNCKPHLMLPTSDRVRRASLCVAVGVCAAFYSNAAFAQYGGAEPISAGAPSEPPLTAPVDHALPTGQGMLTLGPFLLSPTLDVYSFYNSNIYSSPTNRLSGPGFRIRPGFLADWDTGIHDLQLYGNIDSDIYPTLDGTNDTFNRQAGAIDTYSPLPDLTFSAQFDYTHNDLANVVANSLPTQIISNANPRPFGTAGIFALQQQTVNPNDTFTATFTAAKEFNRAFVNVGTTLLRTQYQNTPLQDFDQGAYYGSGGIWITPQFYAFTDGIDANSVPDLGPIVNSYRVRAGIGSARIGAFQGSIYYGSQGTSVDSGGKAGGGIYGAILTYFPTPVWSMSIQIDRLLNRSDITASTQFGLAGLALSAIGVPTGDSVQLTAITYRTDYALTDQVGLYALVSDNRISYLDMPRLDDSWLVAAGASYQATERLSLSLDYQYARLLSTEPGDSFTQNLVSLGAHYRF